MYVEINTPDDWWKALEENMDYIKDILEKYLAASREKAEVFGNFIRKGWIQKGKTIIEEFDYCFENKIWARCWLILQKAWSAAPDSPRIHQNPGWGMFCDLCSETWVFQGEENEKLIPKFGRKVEKKNQSSG